MNPNSTEQTENTQTSQIKEPINLSEEIDVAISDELSTALYEDEQTEKLLNDAASETEKSFMDNNETNQL